MANKDLQEKLDNIERGLAECRNNLSNLDSEVDDILAMCCKLDSLWRDGSLETCQKLQNLLFPNGILWDKEKDNYRTFDENEALSIIARLSVNYKNKKEENSLELSSFVSFVRLIGLEPTRLSTPDPKSGASTNFATGAGVLLDACLFLSRQCKGSIFF